jgi:hypothetical protein
MNNNDFSNENTQFVLSYELLCLLRWLVEHDAEKLKKIIAKSYSAGLKYDIEAMREGLNEEQTMEDIQHGIVDFFDLMEILLQEVVSEKAVHQAVQKNLMPTLDQIDTAICDDATVRSTIEKATVKIEHNPGENPKEVLFKELLKQWKPNDKNVLN